VSPRRLLLPLAAAVVVAATSAAASAAQARPANNANSAKDLARPGVLVRAHGHAALPRHSATVDSLNWSGYAVTGSGISGVTGTFVVPSAGLVPPGFAATWAGIGGYNTRDLIQAGVAENSLPSNPLLGPQYYAWYELLPAGETQLSGCSPDPSCAVGPGDSIEVNISSAGSGTWNISMTNAGKWSFSKTVAYSSSESSAEWILEAPTLAILQTLLAPVGTVHFGPTSTFTSASGTETIAGGSPVQIDLGLGLVNEAIPSALASDGQSFNDCAYALSCAAPAGFAARSHIR
jgi:hypothetical protein